MLAGVSGDLLSHSFCEQVLPVSFAGRLGEAGRVSARRALRGWWRRHGRALGPASSVRDLFDLGAAPMLEALGHRPLLSEVTAAPPMAVGALPATGSSAGLVVVPWGVALAAAWETRASHAIGSGSGWTVSFNGRSVRLLDRRRAYARRHLEFEIEAALDHAPSFDLLWACLRAEAFGGLLDALAAASGEHGVGVCSALRAGVIESVELLASALVGGGRTGHRAGAGASRLADACEQATTVIYRVLFLLFAESRALLPAWHPVYRDGYSAAALRAKAERPADHRGLWDTLQAMARLASAGCEAGDLHVTAFNGRLFAASRTPLAERASVDDQLVGRALAALTTRRGPAGRERIAFRDLGVEQLGAVYESVLDYEPVWQEARRRPPAPAGSFALPVRLVGTGTRRKSSGTFYTPAAITDHLVRTTLGPLVEDAAADDILRLKVLDPAMGSGAFLVAACRYLADAYERALVRDTGRMASDITESERAAFRRQVARRCLYGVDINPMAVQVARLSLWLTTLADDQPLTFLDHHVAAGDSLVGASLDDVARQRPGPSRPAWQRGDPLPFEPDGIGPALKQVLPVRFRLAAAPDTDVGSVRDKEMALRRLTSRDGPLFPLRRLADAWCAWWFWDESRFPRPAPGEYAELLRAAGGRPTSLPDRFIEPRLGAIDDTRRARRFFHWSLAFPEVFFDASGEVRPDAGFDAVIGNPPWEMVRGDMGTAEGRAQARLAGRRIVGFARESGIFRASGSGHVNLYQLFVERALGLARRGGRVGLVAPWGLLSDHGSAELRRLLFERCDTRRIVGFENTAGVFPVHRGIRFVLLSTSPGSPTRAARCAFGLRHGGDLDGPASGPGGTGAGSTGVITPQLLRVLSGPRLAVPWVRSGEELVLLERLTSRFPPLSDPGGWGARFGRELNATEDAHLFEPRDGAAAAAGALRPRGGGLRGWFEDGAVIEGRQIEPFRVDVRSSRYRLKPGTLLSPVTSSAVRRWRLGYRDVASATNRLTVIAALVPPGAVTVHTVFCLRTPLPLRDQASLCALLNSLVLNFVTRVWVTTHVTTGILERQPAPSPGRNPAALAALARLGLRLRRHPDDVEAWARLQAIASRLYGLSRREFARILETFPLIDPAHRSAAMAAYDPAGSEV